MNVTLHINYYVAVLVLAVAKTLGFDISWVWVFFPVWGMVTLLLVLLLLKIVFVGEEE